VRAAAAADMVFLPTLVILKFCHVVLPGVTRALSRAVAGA